MKKQTAEAIKKEIKIILKYYEVEKLQKNYQSLNYDTFKIDIEKKKANETHTKKAATIKNKYSRFLEAIKSPEYQEESKNYNIIMEEYNKKLNIINKTGEAYRNILNNILYEIIIKILHLYFNNVKTLRDHNDFLKIFNYDNDARKYPYLIKLTRDNYNNFTLYLNDYSNIETFYYIKYYISPDNILIYEQERKNDILNYNFIDFEKYQNEKNIFNVSRIKKDIEKILITFEKEKTKINETINKSKEIIKTKNIYNLHLDLMEA